MKSVSSAQNPLIKQLISLQSGSRERRRENLFVIDGWKETQLAMENGYEIQTIYYRKGFEEWAKEPGEIDKIEVAETLFDKIAYRGNTSKVVAVAKPKKHELADLKLSAQPLLMVLDAVEKPGNLGAILRTADAAGIDGVIVCDTATDMYNPNVIRSSVGCIFCVAVAVSSKEDCLRFLRDHKIKIYTASLKASEDYLQHDYKQPLAFVLGTEATGVDPIWEKQSYANIIIPMRGQNDSLNVSNTSAILLFEALRQRM